MQSQQRTHICCIHHVLQLKGAFVQISYCCSDRFLHYRGAENGRAGRSVQLYECFLTEVAERFTLWPPGPLTVLVKWPVRVCELHESVRFVAKVDVECNAVCSERHLKMDTPNKITSGYK